MRPPRRGVRLHGGPLFMFDEANRIPYRYDVSSPVPVYTDLGPFEIVPSPHVPITNERADEIVAFAFKQWTDVPTSAFQAQVIGDFASIGLRDVKDAATAALVIGPENGGGIHVIYDADGSILRDFFGTSPSVLGIASPEWADETTGTLTESWAVINAQQRLVGDQELLNYAGVFTHEFGHAINLAHSQKTGAVAFFGDARGPAGCTTLPYPTTMTINDIETMYPFINPRPTTGSGLAQSTVDRTDDMAAVSDLYPAPGYPQTHGSIKGRVLAADGKEGLTGVNVIARNVDHPFADAVLAMSGDYTRLAVGPDGSFTLTGLTPGARYVLYTDAIVSGGFPTPQPFFIPGPEEFFNAEGESGDGVTDNRCEAAPVTAVAGLTTEADITLNAVKGAPKFIPIGPGTIPNSITGDGRVVGGSIQQGPVFRWTEEGGVEVLGTARTVNGTMSRDGSVFGGETEQANGLRVASLLRAGAPWETLPLPAGITPCGTDATTSYGVAEIGKATSGAAWVSGCRVRPFLWTPTGGTQMLPTPANVSNSRPNTISADGSTVVGWWQSTGNSSRRGARWVNGQFEEFSTPELSVGEAQNTNPDGSVIVGAGAGPRQEPWRWTPDGGVQFLGRLAPFGFAGASAISDDGQIIGGVGGGSSISPATRISFLWMPKLGTVNFEQFLRAQGTYFGDSILNAPLAMSSDGQVIVRLRPRHRRLGGADGQGDRLPRAAGQPRERPVAPRCVPRQPRRAP